MSLTTAQELDTHDRPDRSTGSAGPRPRRSSSSWIASALAGNAFAATLAERMRAETEHAVHGLGRSPGRLRPAGPGAAPGRARATRVSRADYAVGTPVYAHRGRDLPAESRVAVEAGRRGPRGRDQGRVGRRVLAGARPGPGDRRVRRSGPYRIGRVAGRDDEPGGRRAAGLRGVRAVPRRAGARGPDEAARGARRAGRARPLAGPPAPVRRRRRGVRRHRGDPRPRHRAGRLDRPGLPPGLRGRARLLAVAEPRRAGAEGAAGPARARLGQPRPPHVPLLAAVLPAPDRHVRDARASTSASGSTRASTPAGAPRSSSTRRPGSSSSPTSTSPPRRPTHDFAHHALPDLPRPEHRRALGRPARRVDPRGRHAPPRGPVRLRRASATA